MDAYPVKPVITALVEQHAAEVAALTMLRTHAVRSARWHSNDTARIDGRIAAHVDGLREAGDAAWTIALDAAVANPEIGELATAALLAFCPGAACGRRLRTLADALAAVPSARWAGAGMAARWCDPSGVAEGMRVASASADVGVRSLALGAAMFAGRTSSELITAGLRDPRTAADAAQAAGVLGGATHRQALGALLRSDDLPTRFAAARALTLRGGEPAAWKVLLWFAESRSPFRDEALDLAMRHAAPDGRARWLHGVMTAPGRMRDALIMAGAWGDPLVLPWVVECLRDPQHGRLAGAVFTLISGTDLDDAGLSAVRPDDAADDLPSDDPEDTRVEPDPEHDLSWPDPAAVAQWLAAHPLPAGERHLAGRVLDESACTVVLANGFQHQRQAAALELVRLTGGVFPLV